MNKQTRKTCIFLIIGLILILFSAGIFIYLDIPTFGTRTFTFESTYAGDPVTLQASYTECRDAEYAVLICPGYSCDRQKWRPMANLVAAAGASVMTFDYAGQGASSDTIGFDNAKTDSIPVEIADAIEVLHEKSGIDYDHIILLGHSMGGRSILRLLSDYNNPDAETTVTARNISNVILFSPEVNYNYNAQASLFAGTSDETQEPWRSYNPSFTGGVNVYLYGSTADDIVSDEDMREIYRHLTGEEIEAAENSALNVSCVNAAASRITLGITTGVLHSYEMYSPKFCAFLNDALSDIGLASDYPPVNFVLVYIGWFAALLGLACTFISLNSGSGAAALSTMQTIGHKSSDIQADEPRVPALLDEKAFLLRKLLLWLPAIPVAFLICCICVVMPFGSPVMNIPYMCFISGYGIVMLLAYRKGHFKGTDGRLPKALVKPDLQKGWPVAVGISLLLCLFVWFVLHSTMYRLIPFNARLFWVILATVFMAAGFYVSGCESDMLKKAGAGIRTVLLYNLIQYVALFLLIIFYAVIKSYSGMIGQAQNMLLLYIFCVPLGNLIRRFTGSRLLGAAVSAFLFQTIMITSAALIAIF